MTIGIIRPIIVKDIPIEKLLVKVLFRIKESSHLHSERLRTYAEYQHKRIKLRWISIS